MVERGKSFNEIYDILALRVIVDKIEDCYLTLGVLHQNSSLFKIVLRILLLLQNQMLINQYIRL